MRSWLALAALCVAVAALGAWVYFKPPARESATYALSTLRPKEVTRLRLERIDQTQGDVAPAVVLERQETG